ncbi:hypothetical protein B0H12DRAFT_701235 [Mycena haematopus]|nr:hypothetical protein B0H12DRAFT_701235 [Mycena haematopus]
MLTKWMINWRPNDDTFHHRYISPSLHHQFCGERTRLERVARMALRSQPSSEFHLKALTAFRAVELCQYICLHARVLLRLCYSTTPNLLINATPLDWNAAMEYGGPFPNYPTPFTTPEASDNTWSSDAFDPTPSAGHPDVVGITVEGPPADRASHEIFGEAFHETSTMHYGHDEEYPIFFTPPRQYEQGYPPVGMPGLQSSNSCSYGIRSNSFTAGHPIPALHFRTYSDTTQSRPHFDLPPYQLMGSAVEDDFSPVELSPASSIPSSPTHSGQDLHSPVPPWVDGRFLAPPAPTFGPQAQSFRGSDTSSNRSSSPNLDWDSSAVSFDLEDALQQDDSLHPPMLPPSVWDANYLAPTMMYRNSDTSSLFSSDTSSVGSPNPNTEWDLVSTYNFHPEDTEVTAQDDNSPKTNSSNETERPASRLGEDFAQNLQLQDRPTSLTVDRYTTSGYAVSHPSTTSADDVPHHLDLHPQGSATAGSGPFDLGTHGPFGQPDERDGFRSVVSTEAGRIAAYARRKGPARFFCEHCNANFTAKHNLRNHLKSHTSTKDCICEMCGRGFGTKHVLKRHEPKCNANRKTSTQSSKAAA